MAMEDIELWERQPFEHSRCFQAFAIYRDMGPDRALRKVAHELSKSYPVILKWNNRWFWQERVAAYDQYLDRIKLEAQAKARQEMAERQAREGKSLQNLAIGAVAHLLGEDGKPKKLKASDIARLLEVGVKIERLAVGEPTENVKEEGIEKVKIIRYPATVEDPDEWTRTFKPKDSEAAQSPRGNDMGSATGSPVGTASVSRS